MPNTKIAPEVYSVGIVDKDRKTFHGHTYTTKRGTTYNSYLILDEKVTLIDTALGAFSDEFISNIREVVAVEKIDYIIANHLEMDHSGSLPALLKLNPKIKIFCTQKCKEGLFRHYYGNWDIQAVKSGDNLKLGRRTLQFIETPMIHWPDSMVTYCPQEKILFSNDSFGQHFASSERFDDQVDEVALMDEAVKYYANILWPLSPLIQKKVEEIIKLNLSIDMIATGHGIIWRKNIGKIINSYLDWSKNAPQAKAVVVYETMWGSTEKMAKKIAEGLADSGVSVKLFNAVLSDRTEIIKEMFEAKGYLIGSSTHDNSMLSGLSGLLEFVKGLKPKNRIGCAFGSYGWAGGAVKEIEEVMKQSGIETVLPGLSAQYVPDENDIKRCYALGKEFAAKIKGGA